MAKDELYYGLKMPYSITVTMALDKLKEIAHYRKSLDERNQPTISDYNIAELLREVKAKEGAEGQLGKYIPDDFLTNEKDEAERKTFCYTMG